LRNLNRADLLVIAGLCAGILLYMITLIMGIWEIITAHRLKKHARSTTARIEDIDIKSAGQAGTYGKIRFTYTVNDTTYTKKQTINKYVAMGLLSGPKEVSILFLPKKPSVARLVQAPTNTMRIRSMVIVLITLVVVALLILIGVLLVANNQPSYY
jgi:hypothetical protein